MAASIHVEGSTPRSRRHNEVLLYTVAAVLYVSLSLRFTTVFLNWIVGPLFPLLVVFVVPAIGGRVWRARRR